MWGRSVKLHQQQQQALLGSQEAGSADRVLTCGLSLTSLFNTIQKNNHSHLFLVLAAHTPTQASAPNNHMSP